MALRRCFKLIFFNVPNPNCPNPLTHERIASNNFACLEVLEQTCCMESFFCFFFFFSTKVHQNILWLLNQRIGWLLNFLLSSLLIYYYGLD